MKKKKFIVVFLFITFAHLLFSQDLLFLKEFNIKGKKELKIVKMIERNEFYDINKPVMYSKDGRVTNLLFYDGDLLIKEWESTSYNDNGLYWYDFNSETNLFDLKVNDSYKETLYFYDEKEYLSHIKKTSSGKEKNKYFEYLFDENDNLKTSVCYEEVE